MLAGQRTGAGMLRAGVGRPDGRAGRAADWCWNGSEPVLAGQLASDVSTLSCC